MFKLNDRVGHFNLNSEHSNFFLYVCKIFGNEASCWYEKLAQCLIQTIDCGESSVGREAFPLLLYDYGSGRDQNMFSYYSTVSKSTLPLVTWTMDRTLCRKFVSESSWPCLFRSLIIDFGAGLSWQHRMQYAEWRKIGLVLVFSRANYIVLTRSKGLRMLDNCAAVELSSSSTVTKTVYEPSSRRKTTETGWSLGTTVVLG